MRSPEVELRRFPRIRSDIRVRAFVPADAPASDSFGRGYDISEGGMGMLVPMPLAPAQEVLVVFDVPPSRRRLGVRAVVRYARGYRYGVEFQPLLEPDLMLLRSALAELASVQGQHGIS
jgi:PilZ domain